MPLYRNRIAALLAMLATAMSALWPLISQAKPRLPGAPVPVCTIEGITHYIELPATDPPLEKRSAAHHDHCKMCLFGADRLAALPVAAAPFEPGVGREAVQPSFQAPKSFSSLHLPAQPRAPPAAS